jgi:hypothetical protein
MFFQNAVRHGCRTRAYMDVYTAVLKKHTDVRAVRGYLLELASG